MKHKQLSLLASYQIEVTDVIFIACSMELAGLPVSL